MLNRWIEPDLLDAVGELGVGCIVFSPLAQGCSPTKYLDGVPEGSRASRDDSLAPNRSRRRRSPALRALNAIAAARGQTLAQMALAWALRDPRDDLAADRREQRRAARAEPAALEQLDFAAEELAEIDRPGAWTEPV